MLAATNSMISVTITPTTVLEIGGVGAISWTTTLYVVASIVAAAAGGLLRARLGLRGAAVLGPAGVRGRRAGLRRGAGMAVLLAGRLVQGLGAGLALALSYACIRILFPQPQWPRLFALISAVWAIAALGGPLVGRRADRAGELAHRLIWRWPGSASCSASRRSRPCRAAPAAMPPRDGFPLAWLSGLGLAILLIAAAGNSARSPARSRWSRPASRSRSGWCGSIGARRRACCRAMPSPGRRRSASAFGSCWRCSPEACRLASTAPLVLQALHGQPPLVAGYVLAWEALCWSLAAMAIARLDPRYWRYGPGRRARAGRRRPRRAGPDPAARRHAADRRRGDGDRLGLRRLLGVPRPAHHGRRQGGRRRPRRGLDRDPGDDRHRGRRCARRHHGQRAGRRRRRAAGSLRAAPGSATRCSCRCCCSRRRPRSRMVRLGRAGAGRRRLSARRRMNSWMILAVLLGTDRHQLVEAAGDHVQRRIRQALERSAAQDAAERCDRARPTAAGSAPSPWPPARAG